MKRKLFNAALFGAVLIAAPVSTFVSCADYDNDITSLQNQVDDLKALVDQKEATIKNQIAALEAQDKALEQAYKDADAALKADLEKAIKDGDAALKAQIEDCQNKCKGEFAAVRAELEAAKKELQDALAAAEKKLTDAHAADVAKLVAADGELQKGIDAAKADIEVLKGRLDKVEGDVKDHADRLGKAEGAIKDLQDKVKEAKAAADKAQKELDEFKSYVDGELKKVNETINKTKTELQGQITENANAIKALQDEVKANKAEFDSFKSSTNTEIENLKKADVALGERIDGVVKRVEKLEADNETNKKDIKKLQEDLEAVQKDLAKVAGDVAKNTKALVDLAARMVDAELAIADATEKLALLTADYEAFKVAQAAIDAAQDAKIAAVIASYTVDGQTYDYDNINKAYKAALDYAKQAADLAQANAEAYAKKYADDNFYNKAKVDEFVAALEAADAKQDADFQMWIEQVLNPAFDAVWGELLDEDGNSRLSVLEEGLSNTQKDVMDLSEGLMELTTQVNANTIKIAEVEEAYKAADEKMAADFRAWIEQELNPAFAAVYETIAELGKDLSAEVKGFVLEPASYYEGIQAIEGTSYEYTKWNVTDALNPVQDGDYVQYCPAVTAHYHINPSAAVLSTNVANYSYAVLDRTNRGVNTQLQPVVTTVAQNGGMLDVTLKLTDASANKTPQTHMDPSEVTVMALQYTNPAAKAENQVVTSDYAVLYLNPLREVSLVSATNSDHEITDVYAQVVPNNDQDWVEYTKSYDIQEHIAAKFGGENSVSMTELPEGFTVKYTAVAGDVTYFTPITADGKITPQLPNGKSATTACVGKNATWRIDIMHGDDVVEVGFYKVTITGEAVIETAPAVITEDILKITCTPTDEALNKNLSLDNVWNKIAEVTGEELAVVKGKYSVSMADGEVAQFEQYTGDNDRVLYRQFTGKGHVTLNADGTVNWVVLDNDPYVESDLRSLTKDVKSMTTYIRVRSNEAISKDTYNEFYMPLTWTPKPIEFWGDYQELSWTYTRVANQWQQSTNVATEKEIRLYADLTKEGVTPFTYDIPAKAMVDFKFENIENQLTFVSAAKDFVNVKSGDIKPKNGHFRFIEHPAEAARKTTVGGVEYKFTVSADGKNFLANDVVIATITEKGVVNLENNATSQLLLNAYEKDQLAYGQTLCARVGFAAECCAGTVKVIDGDFDVRFIKPLTVKATDINISDADDINNAGVITTSILSNIVAFNNYTLAERPNYMVTFGVGIELGEVAKWKTNYNAAADDFTKSLGDNHIAGLFDKNETKGEITYTNNTAVVSEFSVIVPVTLHYNWYTTPVSVDIKLNIGRTQGNSHRR